MEHESIYADHKFRFTSVNPTGYRYDVNNPMIGKLWNRYRKLNGISLRYPVSDDQRHTFMSWKLRTQGLKKAIRSRSA